MGEQSSLKLLLTLNKDGDESHVILIEEIENHLSFSTMAVLLKNIKSKCEGKQIFITIHSTYVLNKLGIDNLILLGQKNTVAKLSDLEKTTRDYFEKLPGYETLRMILSKKTILVEGPSDELIVQKAYIVKYGHLPIEDGIDVICIRGLSFKRFLDIALLLKLEISVVTDNDGDYALNINDKYKEYTSNDNIKIFASKNESLPTLEPQIVDCNDLEIIKLVLKKDFSNKEEAITYMTNKNNKTECALSIFNSVEQVVFPQYINDSITS
jgi:predicted ATP-dependent endonuclease of OLD family